MKDILENLYDDSRTNFLEATLIIFIKFFLKEWLKFAGQKQFLLNSLLTHFLFKPFLKSKTSFLEIIPNKAIVY